MKPIVVEMKHESGAEAEFEVVETFEQAADVIKKFAESYDFEFRNGEPYDAGSDGFDSFCNITYYKGLVTGFMHADGDGPCCRSVLAR
jgi:hypothetical protein